MTKKITHQEANQLRIALQQEIISLLKERGLTALRLEHYDYIRPTDVLHYCCRHSEWREFPVILVGICEDGDWYIKVHDHQEDEDLTIYASEANIATLNIDWLLSIRDNIRKILKIE